MSKAAGSIGWISLVGLAGSALLGCVEADADYAYSGAWQLASGDYSVESVFSVEPEPIVLAARQIPGELPRMHLLALADQRECAAGPLTRYLASVDRRGFRLALRDDGPSWRFYDENCQSRLEVENADHPEVHLDRYLNTYRYLMVDADRALLVLDPFAGSVRRLIGEMAGDAGPKYIQSSLPMGEQVAGLWVLRSGGRLQLVDIQRGSIRSPTLSNVQEMASQGGLNLGLVQAELLAVTRPDGVELLLAVMGSGASDVDLVMLFSEPGACRARFVNALAGCFNASCDVQPRLSDTWKVRLPALARASADQVQRLARALPWVSLEAPCGSGDLVLRDTASDTRLQVPGAADNYTVVPAVDLSVPALCYTRRSEGAERAFYAPFGEEARSSDVALAFSPQPVLVPDHEAYRVFTSEVPPRLGLWRPKRGFDPLLPDVATDRDGVPLVLRSAIMLYNEKDGAATLARCDGAECMDLATGVHVAGVQVYDTQPRIIGETMEVMAFLRDVNPDTRAGELVVLAPELGALVSIDSEVVDFVSVESGAARGIVYAVGDEARRGLWFAPR